MDGPVLVDQRKLTYNGSMPTQDVVWKACCEQWIIERDREREREREGAV